jgi:hypothetical protein
MQRILNFLSHLFRVVVVLVIVGLLPVARAQDNAPLQDANHQRNEIAPAATGSVGHPTANFSAALDIGPGDEVEITV